MTRPIPTRKTSKITITYQNERTYSFSRVENVIVNGNDSLNFEANGKQAILKLKNIKQISFYPEDLALSHHISLQDGRIQFERKSYASDVNLVTGVTVYDNPVDLVEHYRLPKVFKISDIL